MEKSLFTKHSFCNFIVTGNSIVDITMLGDRQYELLMRHFDGYEVTIYPDENGNSSIITKRYANPAYSGFVITPENLDGFIKTSTTENRSTISVCEWGKTTLYKDFDSLLDAIKAFCGACRHKIDKGSCYKN